MKKYTRFVLVILVLIIFVGTLYFLWKKENEKPIVYDTKQAFVANVIKKTVATGSVVPRKEIEIKPQVSGIISKLYVEPGDKIEKGQLIAQIRIIPDMANLNNAEARLERANITFKNAKRDFDRNKELFEKQVIALAQFQQFELALENAKQEVATAKNNLEIIKKGASSAQSKSANTLVRATVRGMVLDVPVEEGNSVIMANNFNEGTSIATLADMSEMVFEGKVDESEVGKIKEGMDLILTIGAIENETFAAKLEHIAPKGMEENGAIQFEIKAAMKLKKNQFIRANYSANADIVLDRKDSVLVIPESLLKFKEDKTPFVEIETSEQEFKEQTVELGLSDGLNVQIINGISKDDKIKAGEKQEIIPAK